MDEKVLEMVRISPEVPVVTHIRLKAVSLAQKISLGDLAREALISYNRNPILIGLDDLPRDMGQTKQISIRQLPKQVYFELKILAMRRDRPFRIIVWDALRKHVDPVWDELSKTVTKGLEDAALLHKTGT